MILPEDGEPDVAALAESPNVQQNCPLIKFTSYPLPFISYTFWFQSPALNSFPDSNTVPRISD